MKLRVRPTGRIQRTLIVATVAGVVLALNPGISPAAPVPGPTPTSAQYQVLGRRPAN